MQSNKVFSFLTKLHFYKQLSLIIFLVLFILSCIFFWVTRESFKVIKHPFNQRLWKKDKIYRRAMVPEVKRVIKNYNEEKIIKLLGVPKYRENSIQKNKSSPRYVFLDYELELIESDFDSAYFAIKIDEKGKVINMKVTSN